MRCGVLRTRCGWSGGERERGLLSLIFIGIINNHDDDDDTTFSLLFQTQNSRSRPPLTVSLQFPSTSNLLPFAKLLSLSHILSRLPEFQYSSLTLRWLSLSIKLPRFLVFFFLPNANLLRARGVVVVVCLADLREEVAPPTQKRTVASSRHAVAAHMKPKLYFPRSADLPMERKLRRPRT